MASAPEPPGRLAHRAGEVASAEGWGGGGGARTTRRRPRRSGSGKAGSRHVAPGAATNSAVWEAGDCRLRQRANRFHRELRGHTAYPPDGPGVRRAARRVGGWTAVRRAREWSAARPPRVVIRSRSSRDRASTELRTTPAANVHLAANWADDEQDTARSAQRLTGWRGRGPGNSPPICLYSGTVEPLVRESQ